MRNNKNKTNSLKFKIKIQRVCQCSTKINSIETLDILKF